MSNKKFLRAINRIALILAGVLGLDLITSNFLNFNLVDKIVNFYPAASQIALGLFGIAGSYIFVLALLGKVEIK